MNTGGPADLAQQVEKTLRELKQTYEDIGISSHEKEQRTQNVYKALQDCLRDQVNSTNREKEKLLEECTTLIQSIRQMQKSIDYDADDQTLRITLPLVQCRQALEEKMKHTTSLHAARFEQVIELSRELRKYADFLEPSFLKIELPPDDHSKALNFNLSNSYRKALDQEFNRVYMEFQRRSRRMQEVATEIVQMWAELGTHQAQTDRKILAVYNTQPEQLGLTGEDIRNLQLRLRSLREEKQAREQRIVELSDHIMPLWEKLNVDEEFRERFLATHRGVSLKVMSEIESEYERLSQLKKDNLHIFVDEARTTIQTLWDQLYYSEDEMLEFEAAFVDEFTEALLSVHEAEIAHLEQLLEERGPILSLIDKHKSLLEDREQLAISSTDASRLTQRGGQRDPTRLLREEKMRKRIAKDLPKIEAELRAALEQWEEESGTSFTVRGTDYLQSLPPVTKQPARSSSRGPASASGGANLKCPPTPGPQTRGSRSQSVKENRPTLQPVLKHSVSSASTATNTTSISRSNAISRPKTPGASRDEGRPKTSHAHRPKTPTSSTVRGTPGYASLSKTPSRNSRPALTNMTHEPPVTERADRTSTNSDTRSMASYKSSGSIRRKMPPPPTPSGAPRLGKNVSTSPSQQTLRRGDSMHSRSSREGSVDQSIRCITPPEPSTPGSVYHNRAYLRNGASSYKDSSAEGMSPKQLQQLHPRAFSGTSSESSSTVVSSENWETFEDSDDDEDLRTMYLQKLRMNSGPKSPVGYGYRNFGGALSNSSIAIVGDDEWDDHERS
ncbi:microtubule associated protein [Tirmania nivea]|nr:microtubule associated protein [Tirmania nivea]